MEINKKLNMTPSQTLQEKLRVRELESDQVEEILRFFSLRLES